VLVDPNEPVDGDECIVGAVRDTGTDNFLKLAGLTIPVSFSTELPLILVFPGSDKLRSFWYEPGDPVPNFLLLLLILLVDSELALLDVLNVGLGCLLNECWC